MSEVEVRGVSKTFAGDIPAVSALDLTIGRGESFAIVGPSGSGKSTLLRLIAGLESPDAGEIWIGGRRVDGLPPHERDLALVFQHPALYPYLSVFENLAFGLRARRAARAEVTSRVNEVAGALGLLDLLPRRPATLSGGQRQRVALGRALARRPRVLLLDEPFSGLDAPLRVEIRARLFDLHRALGTTMIFVTHDQGEALAVGDRLAVLDRGRVVQSGTPGEVYDRPACRFVARFVGSPPMNLLNCSVVLDGEALRIEPRGIPGAPAWLVPASDDWVAPLLGRLPGVFALGVRPEHWSLADASSPHTLTGTVSRVEPRGHETIVSIAAGNDALCIRRPPSSSIRTGDHVRFGFDPRHACWFEATNGGRRLDGTGAGPGDERRSNEDCRDVSKSG